MINGAIRDEDDKSAGFSDPDVLVGGWMHTTMYMCLYTHKHTKAGG